MRHQIAFLSASAWTTAALAEDSRSVIGSLIGADISIIVVIVMAAMLAAMGLALQASIRMIMTLQRERLQATEARIIQAERTRDLLQQAVATQDGATAALLENARFLGAAETALRDCSETVKRLHSVR